MRIEGIVAGLGLMLAVEILAQDGVPVDFARDVQPVLAKRCYSCHGPNAAESGLRLNGREAATRPAESGRPAIVPGRSEASELIRRVVSQDEYERMPPDGEALTAEQIGVLRRWIDQGAKWQEHWAFQPRTTPEPPAVNNAAWIRNPIDSFVLAKLESNGLTPASPADRVAWLRRASFDLTGLPPTPEEVEAFVADQSPRAFENVVERLLDSPHYGERWARHWLDLVRFAETNSFERDSIKPHAWRYRDYVIRAFNEDKPYDQFIREQLAGDEFPDPAADAIIATGFYRLGVWDDEPADRQLALYDGLDDIMTTVGQVFLGLTVNCGRCHDHKIDPFTQEDYYSLLAFFHNITPMAKSGSPIEVPIALPDGQTGHALAVTERGAKPPETFVLIRGNPQSKGAAVAPAFPFVLDSQPPAIGEPPAGARTSGRRAALAAWLASPQNTMTARVMANRIWQHHFGRGIVRSPNNFGQNGTPPTHPELLDWLAEQFVQRGWRIKEMHRLIMLSNAYRMSSQADAKSLQQDPANDLFWRFDMRRLSAEEIRDAVLAVNGRLNPAMDGPGFYSEISAEVLAGQSRPGDGWGNSPPDQRARRSIYIHVKRSLLTPLLEAFDLADPDGTCEARFVTTQPSQSLVMLNGKFMNDQAAHFAARLQREFPGDTAMQVRRAWQLSLSRQPNEADFQQALELIDSLQREHGVAPDTAMQYYCLLVYNLNGFLYLD